MVRGVVCLNVDFLQTDLVSCTVFDELYCEIFSII